jgi:hypothetical protein
VSWHCKARTSVALKFHHFLHFQITWLTSCYFWFDIFWLLWPRLGPRCCCMALFYSIASLLLVVPFHVLKLSYEVLVEERLLFVFPPSSQSLSVNPFEFGPTRVLDSETKLPSISSYLINPLLCPHSHTCTFEHVQHALSSACILAPISGPILLPSLSISPLSPLSFSLFVLAAPTYSLSFI